MNFPIDTDNALSFVDYKKLVNTIKQADYSLDVAEGSTAEAPYVYTVYNGSKEEATPAPKPTKRIQMSQADLQEFLEEYAEGKE